MKKLLAGVLIYALTVSQVFGQAALLPNAKQTFLDTVGNPLVGGTVTSYVPGSANKKTTWQDSGEASNNPNPITLDAAGRAVIYGQGNYRQVVKDANGNTIWDATTTAYGSSVPSGATGTDTAPVGAIMPWAGFVAPTNWEYADGQAVNRADFPSLLAAITVQGTAVTCTSGSPTLGGFADTSQIPVGAPVEATCMGTGVTVVKINSSSQIVVSSNATSTGTVTATVFPWGNGNGTDTFNLPDLRGRSLVGPDAMGGTPAARLSQATTISTTSGSATATVASATGLYGGMVVVSTNVPNGTTISSLNGTTVTLSGNATATASGTAATFYAFAGANAPGSSGGSAKMVINTANLPPYTPVVTLNNDFKGSFQADAQGACSSCTSPAPWGNTSGTPLPSATGTPQGGTQSPLSTVQPVIATNYIIKVKANTTGAGGVVSWGGLIGDIATDATLQGYISGGINYAGLANQADATLLANVSGSTAQATPQSITAWLDHSSGSSAQGTVLSRGASTWAGIPPAASDSLARFLSQTNGVNSWVLTGAGTVQSVALTSPGGIFSVSGSPVTTTGTFVLSTAGTSGGVPYFDSATTLASSTAGVANSFMTWGGAGTAPKSVAVTGLVKGNGVSAPTAYAGTSCTNQFTRSLDVNGLATCATVQNTDLANSGVTIGSTSLALGGTLSAATGRGPSGLNVESRHTTGDTTVSIASTTRVEATTATLTASRAWTLPAASSLNAGQSLIISDAAGAINGANAIVVTRSGSDTINGATTFTMGVQFEQVVLISDGVSKWTVDPSGGGGGGGVSSVATSYPLSGGPITSTGTLSSQAPSSSGRLSVTSTTQLTFAPYKGDLIKIAGQNFQIPSAGITTGCTTTGKSASTLYYVYVFNNSGALNCELSTTGHSSDTTSGNIGTEIKTGDNTRSLVGMAETDASTHFLDADGTRYLLNWFNQRSITSQVLDATDQTTSSATFASLGSSNAVLLWAGQGVYITANCSVQNSIGGNQVTSVGVNGSAAGAGAYVSIASAATAYAAPSYASESLTEGLNTFTIMGKTSAGTLTCKGTIGASGTFVRTQG